MRPVFTIFQFFHGVSWQPLESAKGRIGLQGSSFEMRLALPCGAFREGWAPQHWKTSLNVTWHCLWTCWWLRLLKTVSHLGFTPFLKDDVFQTTTPPSSRNSRWSWRVKHWLIPPERYWANLRTMGAIHIAWVNPKCQRRNSIRQPLAAHIHMQTAFQ